MVFILGLNAKSRIYKVLVSQSVPVTMMLLPLDGASFMLQKAHWMEVGLLSPATFFRSYLLNLKARAFASVM